MQAPSPIEVTTAEALELQDTQTSLLIKPMESIEPVKTEDSSQRQPLHGKVNNVQSTNMTTTVGRSQASRSEVSRNKDD